MIKIIYHWAGFYLVKVFLCTVPDIGPNLLFTGRKGRKSFHRCLSVHNRARGYSFTARPCYSTVGTHPTGMLCCLVVFFLLGKKFRLLHTYET